MAKWARNIAILIYRDIIIACSIYRVFTPELINWYNNFKKGPNGRLLDIIFISSDHDQASWKEYSAKMPWYGVHYNDEERRVIV